MVTVSGHWLLLHGQLLPETTDQPLIGDVLAQTTRAVNYIAPYSKRTYTFSATTLYMYVQSFYCENVTHSVVGLSSHMILINVYTKRRRRGEILHASSSRPWAAPSCCNCNCSWFISRFNRVTRVCLTACPHQKSLTDPLCRTCGESFPFLAPTQMRAKRIKYPETHRLHIIPNPRALTAQRKVPAVCLLVCSSRHSQDLAM